jgi:hypothetical protein
MSGLIQKYFVQRLADPERKHDHCDFFVLDLSHSDAAVEAAKTYARLTGNQRLLLDIEEKFPSAGMGGGA